MQKKVLQPFTHFEKYTSKCYSHVRIYLCKISQFSSQYWKRFILRSDVKNLNVKLLFLLKFSSFYKKFLHVKSRIVYSIYFILFTIWYTEKNLFDSSSQLVDYYQINIWNKLFMYLNNIILFKITRIQKNYLFLCSNLKKQKLNVNTTFVILNFFILTLKSLSPILKTFGYRDSIFRWIFSPNPKSKLFNWLKFIK